MIAPALRARWLAQDAAYAASWQFRSAVSRVRPDAFRSGEHRPVVVIPGVYENWRFMLPLIEPLQRNGHPVHVVPLLRHNRRPVEDSAALVADYLVEEDVRHAVIVAHSKGGLIGKSVMLRLAGEHRIDRMVAICTPFSGSRFARYAPIPSLRAFAPSDATMQSLTQERQVDAQIVSLFGLFDPLVPEGSVLPGARNLQLKVGGHFRILANPATLRTVLQAVQKP